MRKGGRSRSALILVSLSTIFMLLSAVFIIAMTGDFMSARVDEDDLVRTSSGAHVKFDIDMATLIVIEINAELGVRLNVTLVDDRGSEIFSKTGITPVAIQKPLESGGSYVLSIKRDGFFSKLPDLDLSITWTGISSLLFCMLSTITVLIAVPALIVGTVLTSIEIKENRKREKDRTIRRRRGR